MEEREQLILDLQRLKENQFKLSGEDRAGKYLPLMLKYIGDPDADLRDHLIYKTFHRWIYIYKYFGVKELRDTLSIMMDEEHLFYNIGSEGDDSVFTRTFSALVVALILAYHREEPFLDNKEFINIKDRFLDYYSKEKDLRSFVAGKGWADAVSHGADVLDELVACRECDEKLCFDVMRVVKDKLLNEKYSFYEEEDERLTCAVARIIKDNKLSYEEISLWLEDLVKEARAMKIRVVKINIKNFIRSLYFRLMDYNKNLSIIDNIFNAVQDLNSFLEA